MQGFVDGVNSISSGMQRIVGLIVLAIIVVTLIVVFGLRSAAPVVAEEFGERAERLGERAMEAAIEERRAEELAEEGWGYSANADSGVSSTTRNAGGEDLGGWGSE